MTCRVVRVAVVAALLMWASRVLAQVGSGAITGLVTDPAGHALAGAVVTATNVETSATREAITTPAGVYTMTGLLPGTYRVDITMAGYQPVRRSAILIETGRTIQLDVALTVGPVSESVVVTADAPAFRATPSLGTIVPAEAITALPLNGRTFITLAALSPAVVLPPGSLLPRINGGRPRTNEYLFDGISVLQPEPGQVAFLPVIDAIQEFKIETNSPPAEFGRFNGGVINLTTRSGANDLTGTVFLFGRHENLNARNLFAPASQPKPQFRRQQFGGVVGGPIQRGRTFFFADYQGQRQSIGRTVFSTVPTSLQRQGIFAEPIGGRVPAIYDPATTVANGSGGFSRSAFPGNAIPPARFDAVAKALLLRYPEPTSPGTANNFQQTANEIDDQDQWDVRVDHRWTSNRDHAFARLSNFRGRSVPVTPLPDGSGVTSGTLGPQDTTAWSLASSYQRVLGPNLVNELRIGDTRRAVNRSAAALPTAPGLSLGLPGIPDGAHFTDTLPTFLISGYQQLGSPPNTASNFSTSVSEVADTLSWVKGRHTVKAGFDWRWQRLNVVQPPSPAGAFTFNALGSDLPGVSNTGTPFASFLLGQVQLFSIDLQESEIKERASFQEYFIQDEWRVSDRLTIHPGLRYTLNFPSTEINGQTAVFNLETQLLEYPGQAPVRPLKKNNAGPRLGATYRLNDRMLVSAGYGLIWIEMAGITTPFTTPTFPFLQTVTERALDTITPAFVLENGPTVAPLEPTPTAGLGQGVFSVDAGLGSGYVQQWNVALQRELGRRTTLEVAYVGSEISRIGVPDTNLNQLTVDQLAMGPPLLERVPNPFFGTIPRSSSLGEPTISRAQLLKPFPQYATVSLYRNNVGTTNYHGLTARLEQRLLNGLAYSVSYTRSRLMDEASSVFDASILTGPVANFPVADSFDRARERDYSTGDIPHVFVASAMWDVPFGRGRAYDHGGILGAVVNDWSVASIVTLQSGVPVAVTQTTNFNAFAGFGTQRPNLVGDPELSDDERSPARWFNTNAFAIAPQFTLGSASRNPVRGPAYKNVDFMLSRRLALADGVGLEVRVEAFNLLNTTQFGAPNGVAGSAAFGSITTAFDPRVVQLAVKCLF